MLPVPDLARSFCLEVSSDLFVRFSPLSGAWVNAAKVRKAQRWRSFWKLFVGDFLGLDDSCVLKIYNIDINI